MEKLILFFLGVIRIKHIVDNDYVFFCSLSLYILPLSLSMLLLLLLLVVLLLVLWGGMGLKRNRVSLRSFSSGPF